MPIFQVYQGVQPNLWVHFVWFVFMVDSIDCQFTFRISFANSWVSIDSSLKWNRENIFVPSLFQSQNKMLAQFGCYSRWLACVFRFRFFFSPANSAKWYYSIHLIWSWINAFPIEIQKVLVLFMSTSNNTNNLRLCQHWVHPWSIRKGFFHLHKNIRNENLLFEKWALHVST